MSEQQIRIHLALLALASVYALILSRKRVYEWYHPNRTILAVVGGVVLIGLAVAAECGADALPWSALTLYFTLNAVAGVPIAIWQAGQWRRRRREVRDIGA